MRTTNSNNLVSNNLVSGTWQVTIWYQIIRTANGIWLYKVEVVPTVVLRYYYLVQHCSCLITRSTVGSTQTWTTTTTF